MRGYLLAPPEQQKRIALKRERTRSNAFLHCQKDSGKLGRKPGDSAKFSGFSLTDRELSLNFDRSNPPYILPNFREASL